jgi:hypothetical protein
MMAPLVDCLGHLVEDHHVVEVLNFLMMSVVAPIHLEVPLFLESVLFLEVPLLLYTPQIRASFFGTSKKLNINKVGITAKMTTTCVQLSQSKNTCFTPGKVSAPSEIRPISKSKVA